MAPRIAIIGTGLVGTSIGLGLKKAKLEYEIVGHDKDSGAASKAKQRGALDRTDWNLINAIDGAGLVILALPTSAIKPTLEVIAPHLGAGCVVTDTADIKQPVLEWARALLPPSVSFIGGHPLIDYEGSGPAAASADLFTGATYCIIPAAGATPEAVQLLVGLATTLGAEPFFPDAVEHDNFQAAVGHLPIVMAAALVNVTSQTPAGREMRRLSGAAYRQATVLAEADAASSALILAANRAAVLRWMDAYLAELTRLRAAIATGEDLQPLFEKTADARARWLSRVNEDQPVVAPQTASDQIKHFLVGDLGAKRRK